MQRHTTAQNHTAKRRETEAGLDVTKKEKYTPEQWLRPRWQQTRERHGGIARRDSHQEEHHSLVRSYTYKRDSRNTILHQPAE
jgi:hypothetical protein